MKREIKETKIQGKNHMVENCSYLSQFHLTNTSRGGAMLLILDGNSEIGAHVRSNLSYVVCLRH